MWVSELLDPALKAKKSAIERHHLFPKNFLKKQGMTEIRDTNQIANYALVEWADNIDISDMSPSECFPKYAEWFVRAELVEMSYWHTLSEGWETKGYEDFLTARRKAMSRVIRDEFERLLQPSYN